ncbi:hypothetical protein [Nocardia sp. N2S4-5]|uniref:hypothetical protein n=1 Tax=Nocardia sp. N2S4-5 TaxID=3351565 RepID=UPI0037D81F41
MSGSMWIDPQQLRARGVAFAGIGDEVQRMSERLDQALSREGQWWGDDEAGAEVGKSYAGDAKQAILALRELARALRGFGGQVVATAETAVAADRAGRRGVEDAGEPGPARVERALPELAAASDSGAVGARPPASNAGASPSGQAAQVIPASEEEPPVGMDSGGPGSSASTGGAGAGGDTPRSGSDEVGGGAKRDVHRDAPDEFDGRAGEASGGASDEADGDVGGANGDVADESKGGTGGAANREGIAGARGQSNAAPGEREHVVRQSNPPSVQDSNKLPASASPAQGAPRTPSVSARADRTPPGTPWATAKSPPDGPSPAAPPARNTGSESPPARKPASSRPLAETVAQQNIPKSETSRKPAGAEAGTALLRAALALGDCHGMTVSGFHDPDLDADAVGEFLAAVGDVLARYPLLPIRRLTLAAVDETAVVRVAPEPDSAADAPGRSWYIAFDKQLATDPRRLSTVLRDRRRPGAAVAQADERPVYAATVREFGYALDVASDGQARKSAQRSLIAEYLHGGDHTAALGYVVAGYKRWRDQLSGASFDQGRFEPGAALADAFTDVILNGHRAAEPSKTLCGLLTETAARATESGDRL